MKVSGYFLVSLFLALPCSSVKCAYAQLSTSGAAQISVGLGATRPSGTSDEPVIPPNGNFTVFSSVATNLSASFVSGISTVASNIYKYTPNSPIELLSANISGIAPGGNISRGSFGAAVSALQPDGAFGLAFSSDALDLVSNFSSSSVSSNQPQVYFRQIKTNQTVLVSKAFGQAGNTGGNAESSQATVALTGINPTRYTTCFRSYASNLIRESSGSANFATVYCKEITVEGANMTEGPLFSIKENPTDGELLSPSFTPDGKLLLFSSNASVIPEKLSNGSYQVYSYNLATKKFSLISANAAGNPAIGDSLLPSGSYSGSQVVFIYNPTQYGASGDLVGFSGATKKIAVLFNGATGKLSQLNTDAMSVPSNGASSAAKIDSAGKYAVFADDATNFGVLSNGSVANYQVYVKDIKTGALLPVSVSSLGIVGTDNSGIDLNGFRQPPISIGGNYSSSETFVAYTSLAPNLATFGTPDRKAVFMLSAAVSTPKRIITNGASIEAPPDIQIARSYSNGRVDIRIAVEEFELNLMLFREVKLNALATSKPRLTYEIDMRKLSSRVRINRVISRNTTTIRRVAPGRYTIRYRAIGTKGRKTIKSRYSPNANLSVL